MNGNERLGNFMGCIWGEFWDKNVLLHFVISIEFMPVDHLLHYEATLVVFSYLSRRLIKYQPVGSSERKSRPGPALFVTSYWLSL